MKSNPVTKAARGSRQSKTMEVLARAGFATNGVVHALIGLLAIGVAFGLAGQADQGGALSQIASLPGGAIFLWLMTVALAGLGLWLILGAFLMPHQDEKKRIAHAAVQCGKGLAYLALAITAASAAVGGGSGGESGVDAFTATLLSTPGGVIALVVIALGVLAIGVYFVVKGVRRTFEDDLRLPSGKTGSAVVMLGTAGYVAKGIALGIIGVLLGIAAITADASQAAGLDGALHSLSQLPLGKVALVAVGLGFIAYGVYCCFRARLAKL